MSVIFFFLNMMFWFLWFSSCFLFFCIVFLALIINAFLSTENFLMFFMIMIFSYCGGKFILIIFDLMKVTCVIIKFVLFVLYVNNLLSSMFKFSMKSRISNQVMLSTSYWILWSSKNHIWESSVFVFDTFDLIKFYIMFKHCVCLLHLILILSFITFDD